MIRTFVNERAKWDNVTQINTETKEVKIYAVDKELGFPFSEYTTTVSEMGWRSTDEFINRMKRTSDYEPNTEEQTEKEIQGLLKLAKYRNEHNCHTCIILKDGTKHNDIVERLKTYGIEEIKAVEMISDFIK